MGRVLVIEHEATGERRRLVGGRLVIGRALGCDWVLREAGTPSLSRRHCLLEAEGDAFTVRDLGSTNGTLRNGVPVPVDAAVALEHGDVLELGRHRLRVTVEVEPVPGTRPSSPAGASLDAILAELAGGAGSVEPVPEPLAARGAVGPLEEDPLGGFAEELAARPARPLPPPRDTGESRGDHGAPQHESFTLAPTEPPRAPVGADARAALKAFLEGAGLSLADVPGADPERLLREAGAVFAALADGLRELLATRALVKSHAGLERTVIGAALNNPLKYARSRRGAVTVLLAPLEPGDLPGLAAVEAAVRDLQAHEMGLLEAIEAALTGLIARLDPAALEERLAAEPTLKVLFEGGRRARLWELYRQCWSELSQQARRRFMGDFDDAFRAAYERRLRGLRSAGETGAR